MQIGEILRKLADIVDQSEQPEETPAELEPVSVDNTDNTDGETMVPPLQQSLELLKKSQDVDNCFDNGLAGDEDDDDETELLMLRQMAGIQENNKSE